MLSELRNARPHCGQAPGFGLHLLVRRLKATSASLRLHLALKERRAIVTVSGVTRARACKPLCSCDTPTAKLALFLPRPRSQNVFRLFLCCRRNLRDLPKIRPRLRNGRNATHLQRFCGWQAKSSVCVLVEHALWGPCAFWWYFPSYVTNQSSNFPLLVFVKQ